MIKVSGLGRDQVVVTKLSGLGGDQVVGLERDQVVGTGPFQVI